MTSHSGCFMDLSSGGAQDDFCVLFVAKSEESVCEIPGIFSVQNRLAAARHRMMFV